MVKIRVLVVEDSLTVRKRLIEVLGSDPDLEVVAEASDGQRAIELCQLLRPDVMTLVMMLPIMTGPAVTECVMAYCPTPILIVSASTNRSGLFKTYEALCRRCAGLAGEYASQRSARGLGTKLYRHRRADLADQSDHPPPGKGDPKAIGGVALVSRLAVSDLSPKS